MDPKTISKTTDLFQKHSGHSCKTICKIHPRAIAKSHPTEIMPNQQQSQHVLSTPFLGGFVDTLRKPRPREPHPKKVLSWDAKKGANKAPEETHHPRKGLNHNPFIPPRHSRSTMWQCWRWNNYFGLPEPWDNYLNDYLNTYFK